ncbi:hypothetical protein LUZ60_000207 [Juncus effusus]|nr:hypothetical protein LUZ60_000207 [Juncus effusus]
MEMISAGAEFMFQAQQADSALRTEISKLRFVLPVSRLLIERCECWRFKYKAIDVLLPQIKDAAYETASLLDEVTYQELKERVEDPHRSFPGEFVSSYLRKFRNWMKGYPTQAKEIRKKLEKLYTNLKETCDGLGIPENPNQFSKTARPVTSSFIIEPKVFGREKELDELIRSLGVPSGSSNRSGNRKRAKTEKKIDLPESSIIEKKENVSVLPIVGIGGVGKTTLAQMVCNNKIVKSHFELIIWVCVSDNFDVARLTKEIIECATKKACDIDNLDSLQLNLKEIVKSKRFLLVLDDVWSESASGWHRLFGPLKEGCEGSKVIVTTRSLEVAKITSTVKIDPIILEGLELNVYWEFFTSCAFGPEINIEKYPQLKEIGEQIVVKLKGSPLAAKTLGGILSADLNERHWRNIENSAKGTWNFTSTSIELPIFTLLLEKMFLILFTFPQRL